MKMIPVKSAGITHVGHDGKNTMHVAYSSGHTYKFDNVSALQYRELMKDPSIGRHLAGLKIKGTKVPPHTKPQDKKQ